MTYRDNPESLTALKKALRKLERDHNSNPAMPRLRAILLKKVAELAEAKPEECESGGEPSLAVLPHLRFRCLAAFPR